MTIKEAVEKRADAYPYKRDPESSKCLKKESYLACAAVLMPVLNYQRGVFVDYLNRDAAKLKLSDLQIKEIVNEYDGYVIKLIEGY